MTTEAGDGLVYRSYCEDDIAFIRSSWANSYYKGSSSNKAISPEDFHKFHRPLIDRFFSRETATVIICHAEGEENLIIAWIAVEVLSTHLVIHYVYVKNTFKCEGFHISTKLVEKVNAKNKPIIFTHLTDKAIKIMQSNQQKYKRFIYIPHLT
jgi:hypothetical protein